MNSLELLFAKKLTENGDLAYNTTGNKMLDILFMSSYFEKNLDEVEIGDSNVEKLFSMFMRDPRHGLGRRDLGRALMRGSNLEIDLVPVAGRYDDLFHVFNLNDEFMDKLWTMLNEDGDLVKKWMPRLTGKDGDLAKTLCRKWKITEKTYRKMIKVDTVEDKLSHGKVDEINFEHVPSLAMIKYFAAFHRKAPEKFREYLDGVKSGQKEIKVSTTNVYDIYRNREKIDASLFFDKLEKIDINCLVILDTSGSMCNASDSFGKAMSIGHYLAKNSSYCNGQLVSFSSHPKLITISDKARSDLPYALRGSDTPYNRELASMYTGDISNTDFGRVLNLLQGLGDYPEYFVVLSDMEFDYGSAQSKSQLQKMWKERGIKTKIVWWNFNSHNKTVPELDDMGNIFISGYSPMMLKYLEAGFDGHQFLSKLLSEYANKINLEGLMTL